METSLFMNYYVWVTSECNLKCKYCYGKCCEDTFVEGLDPDFDYNIPVKVSYKIQNLKSFIEKDNNPVVSFYGGEPTLDLGKIKEIMGNVKARFMIQTNGLLLNDLPKEYRNRFDTILISIDGDKNLTDYYRGKGVYDKVIAVCKKLKEDSFKGELIARMAVMENTDIFKAVTHLIDNKDFSFSSVHWQLDAMFWNNDYSKRKFKEWAEKNYNPSLKKLIKFWIDEMEKGKVIRIYPLIAVTDSLLKNEPAKLRCGSGHALYGILTDGNIAPCPIMSGMKKYYLGNIKDTIPNKLKEVSVGKPCINCNEYKWCGGRCLYSNITTPWKEEGYDKVCSTVKFLIKELQDNLPRIKHLIKNKKISVEDFSYEKYNGCEIIP